MKITFEDGSVMEFSGSAEGGELTEKEQELAKKVLDDRHQERMKAFEENRIIQVEMSKNQAEISKKRSNILFLLALFLSTTAIYHGRLLQCTK